MLPLHLAVATSAEAMTPAPIYQPEGVITQVALGCGVGRTRVGGVAWPEPPSAMPAGPSAGVHDGTEAFALGTTERPTLRLTRHLADLLRRQIWLFATPSLGVKRSPRKLLSSGISLGLIGAKPVGIIWKMLG